ncbi:MAG TPA: hypothetical protein PJ988_08160, partial [Anaerolinea sp.]|nr:hypothetical protein [Anaerolinea sp.]
MIASLAIKKGYLSPILSACAVLLAWAGFRFAPQLSSLDQLHLITSLAYLLLLVGSSGLRLGIRLSRSTPLAPLPDNLILILGYILPGILGLLPLLVTIQPFTSWQEILAAFSAPDLLWVPVTQAVSLWVLEPHMAPSITIQSHTTHPVGIVSASLSGLGLSLVLAFLWQISSTLFNLNRSPMLLDGAHLALALISSILMSYFSEHFLRGRIFPHTTNAFSGSPKGMIFHAALAGILAFRL